MRARLVLVGLAVVALVLGSCGGALPKLPGQLSAGAGGGKSEATGAPMADMMLRANIRYELAPGVTADAKPAKAYQLGDVTKPDVTRLAQALGVKGAVRSEPDGGWSVGNSGKDGVVTSTGGAMYVSKSGGSFSMYWSYPSTSSGGGCSVPPAAPTTPPAPDAPDTGNDAATAPVCEEPAPTTPTTVPPGTAPTKAEAQKIASDALNSGGVDLHDPKVTVESLDDSGFNVAFRPTLDGRTVDGFEAYVTVSNTKTITGAGGYLGRAKSLGSYDLATPQRAVDRLNESMTAPYAPNGRQTLDMSAPAPAAADGVPVEPTVITLTKAAVGLMLQGDSQGALFLVPAYIFTSDSGDQITAAAADDKYIEQPSSSTTGSTEPSSGANCQAITDNGPIQGWVCPDRVAIKTGETVSFKIYATHPSRAFSDGPCFDGVTVNYDDDSAPGEVQCMACSTSVADGPGKLSRVREHTFAKAGEYNTVFTIKTGPSCGADESLDSSATVALKVTVS